MVGVSRSKGARSSVGFPLSLEKSSTNFFKSLGVLPGRRGQKGGWSVPFRVSLPSRLIVRWAGILPWEEVHSGILVCFVGLVPMENKTLPSTLPDTPAARQGSMKSSWRNLDNLAESTIACSLGTWLRARDSI